MSDWIERFLPVKSFFRVDEVADLLGVHHNTIRGWITEGKLEHVRLPSGTIRVPRDAIIKVLSPYASFAPRRRRIIPPGVRLTRVRR